MRKKYISSHHKRDLLQKLQSLTQGSKIVDEYFHEMEQALMRANVDEDEESTMARFLNGLNKPFAHLVELQHYDDLEELLQLTLKVERQIKRTSSATRFTQSTPPWQNSRTNSNVAVSGTRNSGDESRKSSSDFQGGNTSVFNPRFGPRPITHNSTGNNWRTSPSNQNSGVKKFSTTLQGNNFNPPPYLNSSKSSSSIQYFKCLGRGHVASQCPNTRTMIAFDDGTFKSESEKKRRCRYTSSHGEKKNQKPMSR